MAIVACADSERATGAIRFIAEELGFHREVLRSWVKQAEIDGGVRPRTTTADAGRGGGLEKEVWELGRVNGILRKTSAYLA